MNAKNLRVLMPYAGLILVVVLFSVLTGGKILDVANLKLILEQSIMVVLASIGVIFVMTLGSLDFSQGSILGICSIVAVSVSYSSIPLAIALTVLTGTAIGLLNGGLHTQLRIPSFIVTICTMFAFRGLTAYLTREKALQVPFVIYDMDNIVYKLVILAVLLVVGYYIFNFTRIGRYCRAIGSGEIAAHYSGVSVNNIKLLSFGIAGMMGGIAAFFSIIRTGSASAQTGTLFETDILIALVLGGMPVTGGAGSKYISVMIGGLLLAFLTNGLVMIGVSIVMQQLIKGIVFLGAVYLTVERQNVTAIK
jgi:ribose transport system permease protein